MKLSSGEQARMAAIDHSYQPGSRGISNNKYPQSSLRSPWPDPYSEPSAGTLRRGGAESGTAAVT